jgi:HD-GYP domain-containing protein (c-di-GMP phosphodiesterase class II)
MDDIKGQRGNDQQERIFELFETHQIDVCQDLHFLTLLALTIEVRTDKWRGRTFDALQLALAMNKLANQPIVPRQLVGATLAHDFAMAFLPLNFLEKTNKISKKDLKLMRTHISTAADLIHRMAGWEPARDIILAHHEHYDGQGYPNKLNDMEITPGAKLLAIVDTFIARSTNTMQAIMEINRHSGDQFDPLWVDHFNVAVKQIYSNEISRPQRHPNATS